jgi:hypothetical protein
MYLGTPQNVTLVTCAAAAGAVAAVAAVAVMCQGHAAAEFALRYPYLISTKKQLDKVNRTYTVSRDTTQNVTLVACAAAAGAAAAATAVAARAMQQPSLRCATHTSSAPRSSLTKSTACWRKHRMR